MNTDPTSRPSSFWRKSGITLVGFIVLLAGIIMLATPGPGLLTIAAGLAILATEYLWAERLLKKVRERIQQELQKRLKHKK